MFKILFVVLFALAAISAQALDEVNITAVPYFPSIPAGHNFSLYSGYLKTSSAGEADRNLHYVFAASQNDEDNDPVILWLNGGPGCSSLDGFIYEHGPWVFNTNDSKLYWNDYSWNRNASVIYLESPINVGLSYGPGNISPNDTFTAQDNVRAVAAFFDKFPTFRKNRFYISGESYGGIYVPSFAQALHFYNQAANVSEKINLKGFAVGNGVVSIPAQDKSYNDFRFFERHSMLSPQLVNEYYQNNCHLDYNSQQCVRISLEFTNAVSISNLNPYAIYGICYDESADNISNTTLAQEIKENPTKFQKKFSVNQEGAINPFADLPPCADVYGATVIFNDQVWRTAFNIPSSLSNIMWTICNSTLNYDQTNGAFNNMSETYNFMLQQGYQVLYFSGDADTMCTIDDAQTFFKNLANDFGLVQTTPKTKWTQPGLYNDEPQFAGYYEAYDNLTFVQVAGVGHMVPQWNKPGAFKMINAFINDQIINLN